MIEHVGVQMITVKFDHGPLKVIVTQDYDDVMQGGHVRTCAFDSNGAIVFSGNSVGPAPRGSINSRDLDCWILCEIKRGLNEVIMHRRNSGLMGD